MATTAKLFPYTRYPLHIVAISVIISFSSLYLHLKIRFPFPFYFQISYLWYTAIGCILTMLIGVGVSFFTGFQNPADLDQDLLSPPIASLFHVQTKPRANNVHGITNFGLELDDEKSQVESTKSPKT